MKLETDRVCVTCGGVVRQGTDNWMVAVPPFNPTNRWAVCMKCGKVAHYECLNQKKGDGTGLWCKPCRAEKVLTS